ncbi:hypothetical protein [Thermus scotoductus]|jgi:hypothetical protein|uniref:Uncharacterized protein n=1 Tax=Thermus scotoductus TaxID=37636 RepID=A0A430R7H7_THESC|nr:hypothetical protein [Thermus scotoductus]RTH03376.1 hypothetical protein CSW47_08760 [Thermus scotoductus]RTH26997.1 hypothetical protein CSW40_03915 [Thermus scotoductus]RTI41149.1 hypothetical protein CSW18_03875 [Thermus scotoductus]
MRKIELERGTRRPLVFQGELLWEWSSSPDQASSYYSGSLGRWVELAAYLTEGGKYLLHTARHSLLPGEEDAYEVLLFPGPQDLALHLEAHYPKAARDFRETLEAEGELILSESELRLLEGEVALLEAEMDF